MVDNLAEQFTQPAEQREFRVWGGVGQTIKVEFLPHYGDLPLFGYETEGSSGFDLRAAIPEDEEIRLNKIGARALIPCGFCVELPASHELQIRPRSGLALRNGITVLNTPGTVDSDYRGEIAVILINLSTDKFSIKRGDRIAQGVIMGPIVQGRFEEVVMLSQTERGSGGFGSTGTT